MKLYQCDAILKKNSACCSPVPNPSFPQPTYPSSKHRAAVKELMATINLHILEGRQFRDTSGSNISIRLVLITKEQV